MTTILVDVLPRRERWGYRYFRRAGSSPYSHIVNWYTGSPWYLTGMVVQHIRGASGSPKKLSWFFLCNFPIREFESRAYLRKAGPKRVMLIIFN